MKRITTLFLTLALIAALIVPVSAASVSETFKDVPAGIWYASAVKYVVSHGLFEGVGGGKFAPNATMDRAMFATVLSRVAKADTAAAPKADLNDVPAKRYFTAPVNWAVSHGYMTTTDGGSFAPNEPITRQVVADTMYRYLTDIGVQAEDPAAIELPFKDMDKAADWAMEGIKFVYEKGLMEGNGDGTFDPAGQLTRAQAATVFRRLDKWLAKLDTQPEDPGIQEDPADPEPTEEPDITEEPDAAEEPGDELPFPDYPYLMDDAYIAEFAAEVLRLCNEARAAEGVAPLQYMEGTQHILNARATELITKYSHTRPNGEDFDTIFAEYGYKYYRRIGENIAMCGSIKKSESDRYSKWSASNTAELFFNDWMESSGHRKNIMNPQYTYMGIGLVGVYSAQIFSGGYSPVP